MPKLQLAVKNDPQERLTISLRKSIRESIESYRAYYEEVLGGKVQQNDLLEKMLENCIAEDKDFQRHLKEQAAAATAAAKTASTPAPAPAAATPTPAPAAPAAPNANNGSNGSNSNSNGGNFGSNLNRN